MGKRQTIADIKSMLSDYSLSNEEITQLKKDNRIGVQKLVEKYEKDIREQKAKQEMYERMMEYERVQYRLGNVYIAGVDEVGRGPLAGPVVAAAVVLPSDFYLPGINDSKQLSLQQREKFYHEIIKHSVTYGIGIVHNQEVDTFNIYQATKKAMKKSIHLLNPIPDHCLIDAVSLEDIPCTSESIVKGDEKSVSIAAASIVAKVTRDHFMEKIDKEYPVYKFAYNKGYGTKEHILAIEEFGVRPYHRLSFEPIRSLLSKG